MAKTRGNRASRANLVKKARTAILPAWTRGGPTCLKPRPVQAKKAKQVQPQKSPNEKVKKMPSSGPVTPTTIVTEFILQIGPLANVDIKAMEKSVREIESPVNNFVWGPSEIVSVFDYSSHDANEEKLRISLFHNDYNHDGTAYMHANSGTKSRDKKQGVMTIKEIREKITGLFDLVATCTVIDARKRELTAISSKGAFPNGMAGQTLEYLGAEAL